jgi:hypothetical protein
MNRSAEEYSIFAKMWIVVANTNKKKVILNLAILIMEKFALLYFRIFNLGNLRKDRGYTLKKG